jgi:hypothetical protein
MKIESNYKFTTINKLVDSIRFEFMNLETVIVLTEIEVDNVLYSIYDSGNKSRDKKFNYENYALNNLMECDFISDIDLILTKHKHDNLAIKGARNNFQSSVDNNYVVSYLNIKCKDRDGLGWTEKYVLGS